MTIDDQPIVIVGVHAGAPAFMRMPTSSSRSIPAAAEFRDPPAGTLNVIGRLRPGVSAAAAQAEMKAIAARIARGVSGGPCRPQRP